jgi:hypothetical protein
MGHRQLRTQRSKPMRVCVQLALERPIQTKASCGVFPALAATSCQHSSNCWPVTTQMCYTLGHSSSGSTAGCATNPPPPGRLTAITELLPLTSICHSNYLSHCKNVSFRESAVGKLNYFGPWHNTYVQYHKLYEEHLIYHVIQRADTFYIVIILIIYILIILNFYIIRTRRYLRILATALHPIMPSPPPPPRISATSVRSLILEYIKRQYLPFRCATLFIWPKLNSFFRHSSYLTENMTTEWLIHAKGDSRQGIIHRGTRSTLHINVSST